MASPHHTGRIPLFPLGTTLFPGSPLPLQVFEPRYVALLRHLLGGDGHEVDEPAFGVVGIRQGFEVGDRDNDLYAVGCLAVVDRVAQIDRQRIFVLCHGTRRFRLDRVVPDAGALWTTGEVTWLADATGDLERVPVLLDELREAVEAHAEATGQEHEGWTDTATGDAASYRAAEQVGFDGPDRQALVEAVDTVGRLALALRVVKRETAFASGLGVTRTLHGGPPSLN